MYTAYIIVTVVAAVANIFSAIADFIRYKQVVINMDRAGVPQSWMTMLGVLKAAGAIGLLVGIGLPMLGTAAAVGLVLFFIGAIVTHVRAHFYGVWIIPAIVFLGLAVAALVLRVATPGLAR